MDLVGLRCARAHFSQKAARAYAHSADPRRLKGWGVDALPFATFLLLFASFLPALFQIARKKNARHPYPASRSLSLSLKQSRDGDLECCPAKSDCGATEKFQCSTGAKESVRPALQIVFNACQWWRGEDRVFAPPATHPTDPRSQISDRVPLRSEIADFGSRSHSGASALKRCAVTPTTSPMRAFWWT